METTAAILLRKVRLSETSAIVTWFTQDVGRIKTVAKGARSPKSPFAGKLDLFFDAQITFGRSRRSELHGLREVVVTETFPGMREEYTRLQTGSYFVELIELVTEPEHPAPEIYDLLRRALRYLDTATPGRRALLHFETELARLLGIHGERSGHLAIGRVYHRLPASRAALLRQLGEAPAP